MDAQRSEGAARGGAQGGGIVEDEATHLAAVVRAGGPPAVEAIEVLTRSMIGRALETIDRIVTALPNGVSVDEARLVDRAVAEIGRAALTHDPARGPFIQWCVVLVWRGVGKEARKMVYRSIPCLPLDTPLGDGDGSGSAEGRTLADRIVDPRPRPDEIALVGLSAPVHRSASPPDHPRPLINLREAAERMGISSKTLYRWTAERRITSVRLGRLIRFRPEDIDRLVELRRSLGLDRRLTLAA